jgi:tetratricopeptide (TPR) repeat protein
MDYKTDSHELAKSLEIISKLGHENGIRYSELAEYDKAAEQYLLIAEAYEKAINIIEKQPEEYSTMKTLLATFRSTKFYWLKQAEISKRESSQERIIRHANIGSELQSAGNYEQSIKSFENAINAGSSIVETAEILNEKGNSYYYSGNFQDAKKSYKRATELDSSYSEAWANLGLVSMSLEEYNDAIEYFNNANRLNGPSDMYLTNLGIANYNLEKYEEAQRYLLEATTLNPRSVDALIALGALYNDAFLDNQKATEYFNRAILIDPSSLLAMTNLAEILLITDNYSASTKMSIKVKDSGDEYYGFVARLLLITSLYLQSAYERAASTTLDFLNYFESLPSTYKIKWNFNSLSKKIQRESKNVEVRELLLKLLSLKDFTEKPKEKRLVLSEIRGRVTKGYKWRALSQLRKKITHTDKSKELDIDVRNISQRDPDEYGYYLWELYLVGSINSLSQISKVVYHLHPTFVNPIQEIDSGKDPDVINNGFRLKSRGWGEFQVKIRIVLKNGHEITKYHWLTLSGPTPLDS